ncbi:MAG: BrnT family toxin, partial [Pseudomonadota bacterium]
YTMPMSADFDPKKDAANIKKHGVSLSEGDGVLNDPLALTVEDDSAEGEQRFVTIGMNVFGSLMVVVHTPRGDGTRTMSVRKPDPKERRNYEKGV